MLTGHFFQKAIKDLEWAENHFAVYVQNMKRHNVSAIYQYYRTDWNRMNERLEELAVSIAIIIVKRPYDDSMR
jgi:hypothetical protein